MTFRYYTAAILFKIQIQQTLNTFVHVCPSYAITLCAYNYSHYTLHSIRLISNKTQKNVEHYSMMLQIILIPDQCYNL